MKVAYYYLFIIYFFEVVNMSHFLIHCLIDLYNQYFWWKPHYRVRNHIQDLKLSMCGLCSRLHYDKALKIYEDMEKWWIEDAHCHVPRSDNVFHIPFWTN
jgi:pentatricopeptide repeat protein